MRPALLASITSLMARFAGGTKDRPATGETIFVAKDDPQIVAAIAQARETLPIFWRLCEAPPAGYSAFALNVALPATQGGAESIWVVDVMREADGACCGRLNRPRDLGSLQGGSPVAFNDDQITDWQYEKGGKLYGHFASRAMMDRWNAAQRAEGLEHFAPQPLEAGVQ